ncbi:nitroreductase family deazaflavin-dependent oxidoreductase [Luteipulveratus sp. YIM 133132]|uniref:nitroreductase family deazaflavin-dependent oxidoreductase n=1 Tax=Luteipulveratus flavus TaxID=3031728 RepID=UPI0023AF3DE1|nr:nitroreductase family deazaflavin-dependent oxidoreductase [Luteipulveratus sp. YIM 133132]MDE9365425.1 nitroreductase family deazaflavin-dependent oxidoreductase [Luteipulveratus sp. YIM 133132]
MDPQRARKIWRKANPRNLKVAPWVPSMVVLETTGRRSGQPRRVPLAKGPVDGDVAWLICVHGEKADYARNIAADPRVRLQLGRTWRTGTATLRPMDPDIRARFTTFAKMGTKVAEHDPRLLRIDLDPA